MKKGFRFRWNRRFWKNRGMGAIFNSPDERDLPYVPRDGFVSFSSDASLEQYAKVVDQDGTSSCVGNAVAGAIWIMEKKSGLKYGYPSRMFLYFNSRMQHSTPPLEDKGTGIRSCFKALRKIGVPDESVWKFRRSKVNTQPSFGTWGMADPRKGGEYLSITEVGQQRVNMVCQAISEGYPVVFATSLAESFRPADGPDVIHAPRDGDKIIGGHAMIIVGYKKVDDGYQFRVLNSWGPYWRDGGFCWFGEDYVTWPRTRDFTIVRGWRRINP